MYNQELALGNHLSHTLIQILKSYRNKPYLPVWGELYCILRDIQRLAQQTMQNIPIYPLEPVGLLYCDYQTNTFTASIEELHMCIQMNLDECIESLIKGRFSPKTD